MEELQRARIPPRPVSGSKFVRREYRRGFGGQMIFVGVLIAAIPVVGEGWFPVVHRSPFATLLIYVVLPIGAVFFATWPAAYALILARAVRLGVVCEADVVGRTADGGSLGIWWCPTSRSVPDAVRPETGIGRSNQRRNEDPHTCRS
jgi:hypothetical protein